MHLAISERLMALFDLNPDTGPKLELPPKIFTAMDGEFREFVEGTSLTVRYPNKR